MLYHKSRLSITSTISEVPNNGKISKYDFEKLKRALMECSRQVELNDSFIIMRQLVRFNRITSCLFEKCDKDFIKVNDLKTTLFVILIWNIYFWTLRFLEDYMTEVANIGQFEKAKTF